MEQSLWKPCDSLTEADFVKFPVWAFDLGAEGDDDGADETWVRPMGVAGFTDIRDALFVRADFAFPDNKSVSGVLIIQFGKSSTFEKPCFDDLEILGAVKLSPSYSPLETNGSVRFRATIILGSISRDIEGVI